MDNLSLFNLVNNNSLCVCGKSHLIKSTIIEANSVIYLAKIISKSSTKKCTIIHSDKKNKYLTPILDTLRQFDVQVQTLVIQAKDIFYEAHAKSYLSAVTDSEYIIGMGNDYVISLAKYISYIKQLQLIIIPTKIESDIFATKYFKIHDGFSLQIIKAKSPLAVVVLEEINVNLSGCIASVILKQSNLLEAEINKKIFGENFCHFNKSLIQDKCNVIMSNVEGVIIGVSQAKKKMASDMIELSLMTDMEDGRTYISGYANNVAELICRRLPSVSVSDATVGASLAVATYLSRIFCHDLSKNINYPDLPYRMEIVKRIFKRDEKYILEILKTPQKKEKLLNYLHKIKYFSAILSDLANKYLKTMDVYKGIYFDSEKNHGKNFEYIKKNILDDINNAVEISNKKSIFDILRDVGFLDN